MNLIAAPSLFLVYQMSSIETGLEQGIAKVRNKSGSFFCFCFVKQKSVHCCTWTHNLQHSSGKRPAIYPKRAALEVRSGLWADTGQPIHKWYSYEGGMTWENQFSLCVLVRKALVSQNQSYWFKNFEHPDKLHYTCVYFGGCRVSKNVCFFNFKKKIILIFATWDCNFESSWCWCWKIR